MRALCGFVYGNTPTTHNSEPYNIHATNTNNLTGSTLVGPQYRAAQHARDARLVHHAACAAYVRAYAPAAARRPAPAWNWKKEGSPRRARVQWYTRLWPSDELATLHAPLNNGPRHSNVWHAADAMACHLAAYDEPEPLTQRGHDEAC